MKRPYQALVEYLTRRKEAVLGRERLRFIPHRGRFRNKVGLEVGGPSPIFGNREYLPVYALAARIDGVNFARSTLWEGQIREGETYRFAEGKLGRQFVGEASDLGAIADRSYDFLLSSHSLEHSANPLKCMAEWIRVTRPGGTILLVLPDPTRTFDHRRPMTSFQHLLDDYRTGVGEDDLTHLEEICTLHDLSRDPGAPDGDAFRARSLRNLENRALHHHLFDAKLIADIFGHFGVKLRYADAAPPFHLIALGATASKGS
jgi:SAM-dependent methyltransferase